MTASGTLFIISAPSGAGKTSLVAAMLARDTRLGISVSHTTRARRCGEVDGVNYHFTQREAFEKLVDDGQFLEYACVFGNYYGTSRDWVDAELAAGRDVILEIDWQGALQVRSQLADAVTIFVLPPSLAILEQRLVGRGSDDAEVIATRLAGAREEMSHHIDFDYLVVNDDFQVALDELAAIVMAERCKAAKQQRRHLQLLKGLLATPTR